MRCSESPPPIPPRFVSFAQAVSRSHPLFAPVAAECNRPRAWSWSPGTSRRVIAEKMEGPPRFLGDLRERALFSDPGGTTTPGRYGVVTRPSVTFKTSAPATMNAFGAQSHGPLTRCLRFAASVTRTPRKTRSRLLASSAGRGWLPARSRRKVSAVASPFPKLSWRTHTSTLMDFDSHNR